MASASSSRPVPQAIEENLVAVNALVSAVIDCSVATQGHARIKGKLLHAVSAAFNAAIRRRGLQEPCTVDLSRLTQNATPETLQLPAEALLDDLQDRLDDAFANAISAAFAAAGLRAEMSGGPAGSGAVAALPGETLREAFRERVAGILQTSVHGPVPIEAWFSLPPSKAEALRGLWLAAEKVDWPGVEATLASDPANIGKYAALAGGKLVGVYDKEDDAVDDGTDAIQALAGPIGITFVARIRSYQQQQDAAGAGSSKAHIAM